MTVDTAQRPDPAAAAPGRSELGMISISDRVVEKIASRAASEIPDAGVAAPRVLGRSMGGGGALGVRQTSLTGRPKVAADVDGSIVALDLSISVRWPASIPSVTKAVREHVRERLKALTGMTVIEVDISVTDLATHLAAPPRVH